MTKLEEKLIELGYEIYHKDNYSIIWNKDYLVYELKIQIINDKIFQSYIKSMNYLFFTQTHIDNLQQAFNEMQKDLEVLRQCYE